MTTVLILLRDTSLSRIFLVAVGFCSMTQQHIQLLNTSHIYLSYKKSFMRFPCVELEVSQLGWSEERLNHVLKIDGDKLFKDLLTNKIFSRQILSWNFKMKFCLNRGLV